jgi:hypothetical protein
MPATTHTDTENLNYQVVSSLNKANSLTWLTDAQVAAADTRAGLKAAINAAVVHGDQENLKLGLLRAIDASGLSDSDVLSLTTVAGLIALFPVTTTSQEIIQ